MSQTLLLDPLLDRSAWRGSEVGPAERYAQVLTAAELAELEAAIRRIGDRGGNLLELTRDDYRFEALAARIERVKDELETGRGFALLRGFPVERYSAAEIKSLYWGVGLYLGDPITQNKDGDLIGTIMDVGADIKDTNVRGYLTNGALTPHNDSSDIVALLCMRKATQGGLSVIASATAIYNEILRSHPEYLECLYRGFHYDVRTESPDGNLRAVSRNRIPVYCYFEGKLNVSYNLRAIVSAGKKTPEPLTDLERAAVEYIAEVALRPEMRLEMDLLPGDIQLLNNYVVLHSRTAYQDGSDGSEGTRRLLYRLWVNTHARRLPVGYADRYNSGDTRNGVAKWQ